MRTRIGLITAFSAVTAAIGLSIGVAASAEPDVTEPTTEISITTTDPVASTTVTSNVPPTTTTTTTTTTPTTTVPPSEGDLSLSGAAEIGGAVSRTPDDSPAATGAEGNGDAEAEAEAGTGSEERIDTPGDATQHAERTGDTVQLTEPPATPTTTTLPPRNALPAESGEGRRIVYSKTNMWVWLIEDDGTITRDAPVSGNRQWNLPLPGTYSVSSRSMHTCSIENPSLCWRYMVRFARGPNATWRDNIGFHEIPINTNTGGAVQGDWQLGEPLSGGCVRMATADATFLWNWAPVGTRVVVLP